MADTLVVSVLGLGEVGSAIARDLVQAGVVTRGWDPALRGNTQGIPLAQSGPAAVEGAHVVLCINLATVARDVARSVAAALTPACLYTDRNTAPPQLKRDVAATIEPAGARFVDVALTSAL